MNSAVSRTTHRHARLKTTASSDPPNHPRPAPSPKTPSHPLPPPAPEKDTTTPPYSSP